MFSFFDKPNAGGNDSLLKTIGFGQAFNPLSSGNFTVAETQWVKNY